MAVFVVVIVDAFPLGLTVVGSALLSITPNSSSSVSSSASSDLLVAPVRAGPFLGPVVVFVVVVAVLAFALAAAVVAAGPAADRVPGPLLLPRAARLGGDWGMTAARAIVCCG